MENNILKFAKEINVRRSIGMKTKETTLNKRDTLSESCLGLCCNNNDY